MQNNHKLLQSKHINNQTIFSMMKSLLLSLVALLAVAPCTNAQLIPNEALKAAPKHNLEQSLGGRKIIKAQDKAQNKVQSQSRAGDVMEYGKGTTYSGGLGTGSAGEVGQAISIPANIVSSFKGAKITKVRLGVGQITSAQVKFFVTTDIETPSYDYSQDATITAQNGWNEITLSTPYVIGGDKAVYIGYTCQATEDDYPLGCDATTALDYDFSYFNIGGAWYLGPQVGANYNACIVATLEDVNLPNNKITFDYFEVPYYIKTKTPAQLYGEVTNHGGNTIEEVEVTYQLGNEAATAKTVKLYSPINYGETSYFIAEDVVYAGYEGTDIKATAKISKLNGNGYTESDQLATFFWASDRAFDRTVVVEEGTGTWCGYCPMGITAMEQMKANHPDDFIGIAIHRSQSMMNRDPMVTSTYNGAQFDGYPSANVNRYYNGISPDPTTLELAYSIMKMYPVPATVEITSAVPAADNSTIAITTTTETAVEMTGLALAYVVIENQVGPYKQTNYFSTDYDGTTGGFSERYGWGDKGASVEMLYDDVARDVFDYAGLSGSVSANVPKCGKDSYTYNVSLNRVTNKDNYEIAVLLIDTNSGEVLNADKISASEAAGVTNVEIDNNDAPAVYYNLNGVQVDAENISAGIYVKVQGNKVSKIAVK